MILIFNLELVPQTDHDPIATKELVLETSHDLNLNLNLGIAPRARSWSWNMLRDNSFVDHSLSLIISKQRVLAHKPPYTYLGSTTLLFVLRLLSRTLRTLGTWSSAPTSARSPWWAWQDHARATQGSSTHCHCCLCGPPQNSCTWCHLCVHPCSSQIAVQFPQRGWGKQWQWSMVEVGEWHPQRIRANRWEVPAMVTKMMWFLCG